MKKTGWCLLFSVLGISLACNSMDPLSSAGKNFQKDRDYPSLKKVVEGLEEGADKKRLRQLLGDPIDMGFDYRFLLDSTGAEGCVVGAVFHLNSEGKVDDKWIGEICE